MDELEELLEARGFGKTFEACKKIPLFGWVASLIDFYADAIYTHKHCKEEFHKEQIILSVGLDHLSYLGHSNKVFALYAEKDCLMDIVREAKQIYRWDSMHCNDKIDYFRKKEVYDCISLYDGSPECVRIINKIPFITPRSVKRFAKEVSSDFVRDTLKTYSKYSNVNEAILSAFARISQESGLKTIQTFNALGNKSAIAAEALIEFPHANDSKYQSFLDLIVMYKDNHLSEVCQGVMSAYKDQDVNFDKLMKGKIWRAVHKSKDPRRYVTNLLVNAYKQIHKHIDDKKVRKSIGFEDLDYIISTKRLIEDVHEERDADDLDLILGGFYTEMNRAIDQGYGVKQKISNLHQYCKEVQAKMRDNAYELMVMVNG